jgi:hypothetical protein
MRRLNIVVPYRAREEHLRLFVPFVRAYFSRDKVDREIPYHVLVVEQENGLPFNRGALNNIGFMLGRDESDYTAFHDVDYLPIWADYSFVDTLTPLVWFGADVRPIVPGQPERLRHDLNTFFGGVVLVPNSDFERVNGFANQYWGWGYEDCDLVDRFTASGFTPGRRRGTFKALDHVHQGLDRTGRPTLFAKLNEQLHRQRWAQGPRTDLDDGLSNLRFEILSRRDIPDGPLPERSARWEIVTVRLNMQVPSEHMAALAKSNSVLTTGWKVTMKS